MLGLIGCHRAVPPFSRSSKHAQFGVQLVKMQAERTAAAGGLHVQT
jgi:hypothetical protein